MKFILGQKVRTKASGGAPATKGIIYNMGFLNGGTSGAINFSVKTESGAAYNYSEGNIIELRTQTLYAFMDPTEEVHWATKNYTKKELTEFGFTPVKEFNKTIDLE
jgi:predicted Zn-dependent peptidase